MLSRYFPVVALLLRVSLPDVAQAQSPWFPFSPSGLVAAGSAVDASSLLTDYAGQDPSTVIETRGHLQSSADGHFHFTNTRARARFFGINVMSNTMFPPFADAPQQPGEYSDTVPANAADQLATRLAQLGVNMVRLHFADGAYARPVSIWDPSYPNDTLHFDALQVARLDYFISRLKAHGIYVDLNLHAGRTFRSGDGVLDCNLFPALSYDKPATEFDPTMIALQQQYAATLLNHVNPYTQQRLADDPAVAFVEISNEDSMLSAFANDQLGALGASAQCLQGMACGLPPSYSAQLDASWNAWLQTKYGSGFALQTAWAPPVNTNAIQNATFATNLNNWTLRYFNGAQGTVAYDNSSGVPAARVDISQVSGALFGVQLDQSALSLTGGQQYDLSITFKGTAKEQISVDLIQDESPYAFYQNVGTFNATADWQTVTTTFQAVVSNSGHVQMNLNLGAAAGSVWISQVILTPHPSSGLGSTELLSAHSVTRQSTADLINYSAARNLDLTEFYYGVQQSYYGNMRSYLLTNIGVKAMITGTAVLGLPLNADLASQQDFVDEHYYYDYPNLTDADTSVANWTIQNTAFTSNPLFLLFNIASLAVQGKPFTVSEAGEPFPNDHQSEWLTWLSTFANFQDWDAIMPYTLTGWPDNYFSQTPAGWTGNYFFGLSDNVIAQAQFPVAARIFLSGQNSPAAQQTVLSANRTDLLQTNPNLVSGIFFGQNGVADWLGLVHSSRTTIGTAASTRATYAGAAPGVVSSDQGELQYSQTDPNHPLYTVDSSALQSVTGFIAGKTVNLTHLSLDFSASSAAFGSVTLQPIDGQPIATSGHLLLSVLTRYHNTGMIWNSTRTSVGTNWGTPPTTVEPLTATYTFNLQPGANFRIFTLDAQGNRTHQLGSGMNQFTATLDTGTDGTVWYELLAEPIRPSRAKTPQK